MEITHNEAIKAAMLLQSYCKERYSVELGTRGCRQCIFSYGEPRRQRCILNHYLEGILDVAEKAVHKNYERLTQND